MDLQYTRKTLLSRLHNILRSARKPTVTVTISTPDNVIYEIEGWIVELTGPEAKSTEYKVAYNAEK